MYTISEIIIQTYDAIQTGNNELISQATEKLQEIYSDPNSISHLIEVLSSKKKIHRQQSGLALKRVLLNHKNHINDEKQFFFYNLFNFLLNESDTHLQRIISDAISELIDNKDEFYINIINLIIEKLNESFQNKNSIQITGLILILQYLDLDEINISQEFIESLIEYGLTFSDPSPSIELGFMYGNLIQFKIEDENDLDLTFFENLWRTVVDFFSKSDDSKLFEFLITNLHHSLEENSSFSDPLYLFNFLQQFIGNLKIPPYTQLKLITLYDSCIEFEEVYEYIIENQLLESLIDQYFILSALLFSEDDTLAMSDIDIFTILSSKFVHNEDFVALLFDKIPEFLEDPRTRPGVILSLTHCFENAVDNFIDNLDEVVSIILNGASDEYRLVRDSSAFAITSFSEEFQSYLDDYTEQFSNLLIDIFMNDNDPSKELIIALTSVYSMSTDTDSVFDKAYNFLISLLEGAEKSWQYTLFLCIVALSKSAKQSLTSRFDEVFNMLVSIISNSNEESSFLIGPSLEALANLSLNCPELFKFHSIGYISLLNNLLLSDDNDIIISCLKSMSQVSIKCYESFENSIQDITNKLINIGSKDNDETLKNDILEHQKKLQQLAETGETEFDIDLEENKENNNNFSYYSIPALSLSTLCSLLINYIDIFIENSQKILDCISIQANSHESDTIDLSCHAMSIFIEALSKSKIDFLPFTEKITLMALNIIDNSDNGPSVASALNVLRTLVNYCGINSLTDKINEVFTRLLSFFNGTLRVQTISNKDLHEVYESIGLLFEEMIVEFHQESAQRFSEFIPILLKLSNHKQLAFQEFSLPILGYLVEESGSNLDQDILNNILMFAISSARKGMPVGFYVLNQFTTGSPSTLIQMIDDILIILKEKLTNTKKKAENYKLLIDRVVGCLGEIERNILNSQFPYNIFGLLCLKEIPAKVDISENHGMMRFYLSLAENLNLSPKEEFLKTGIRIFSKTFDELGEAFITDPLFEQVKSLFINLWNQIPNSEKICNEILKNDEILISRIKNIF